MAKTRGGKRTGAGKKPLYGIPMTPVIVLLPPDAKEFFIALGDGNLSAGVRLAWQIAERASSVTDNG